jgi:hypothetical protein
LFNLAASLSDALAREKWLEAKVSADAKALKDVETRLAATKARTAKAEKALAEANQRQTKREQAVVERIDALSISFGSKYFLVFDVVSSVLMLLVLIMMSSGCSRTNLGGLQAS